VTAPAVAQVLPLELVPEAKRSEVLDRAKLAHPEEFAAALDRSHLAQLRDLCASAWVEIQSESRPKRKRRRHRR
jgi:hypothetical protein